MIPRLQRLNDALRRIVGSNIVSLQERCNELTLEVDADEYLALARVLRDHPELRFEQLIDLCGVDYGAYGRAAMDVAGTVLERDELAESASRLQPKARFA